MNKISGNAVVGQSGGPTSAINATLAGVISGCLEAGIDKIYGMKNGIEGLLGEELFDLRDCFDAPDCKKLSLLSLTPAAALGSCRKKLKDDETAAKMYEIFEKYDISYFFYIGGNDSMDAVARLTEYAKAHPELRKMHFIGVPKTIDNDLVMTDHTPGFGSAAKYIACAMQEVMRDCGVYKTKAVTIVEIMGRDAGWLTASAGLTKAITGVGPALIYLPECAFSEEKFLADLKNEFENGEHPYVVVAVSEGIRHADGSYAAEAAMSGAVDSFGHKYLSGTGKYLENLVREKIGCKVRSVEVNILQRCAGHLLSKTDIYESIMVGRAATGLAFSGESGKMAAYVRRGEGKNYCCDVEGMDVTLIANAIKKVPREFINDDENGITDKCVEYLMPLIAGECEIPYKNGIPCHFEF
ncbi:MAG: 6-phosphofructokinase [Ruminococcaceae bacterium]|nr:6-phosphofructokinase [Oscillospiraceae bacterium]